MQIWNGHFNESDSSLTEEELEHTCSMHRCIGGGPCTIHLRLCSGGYRSINGSLDAPQSMGHPQQHNRMCIKNLPLQALRKPQVVLFLQYLHLLPRASFRQGQHARCFRHQARLLVYMEWITFRPSNTSHKLLLTSIPKAASRNVHTPWPRM